MIYGQFEGYSGQGTCPAGVTVHHRLSIKFGAIGIRSTQNNNQVVFALFVNNFFNILLTLRVKCTGGGSDKTLSLDQQWLCSGTFHTGGYGWTNDLPADGFDGQHVRVKDLWGRTSTQIFTEGISPEMHWEFAIQYEKRFLEHFGLGAYGCCEPLHNKMDYVSRIPNLRRVSMSPWVDIDMASEAVGDKYVYSLKPHPAVIAMDSWHPDLARQQLEDALQRTRRNVVEVNLQDIHTVRGEPARLTEWTKMAMELSEKHAQARR